MNDASSMEAGGSRPASLFESPWWLDAVAPGSWGEVRAGDDRAVQGRLVYQRVTRWGFSLLRNPPLTQTVGPRLELSAGKRETRLAQVRELVTELIGKLPKSTALRLVLAKDFDDFLPFRWAGMGVNLACTYSISPVDDPERLWREFGESTRRAIRKAERQLAVRDDVPLDVALGTAGLSFARQGLEAPYDAATVDRAVAAARRHAGAWVLAAEDSSGRRHASMVIVYDKSCAYYLIGGADPERRESGAQSLLMWHALRLCAGRTAEFDFEGSSNAGIERFFRGFGPRRHPLLVVTRSAPWVRRASALGVLPASLAPGG